MSSNLVPKNKTETSFAERLVVPLEERRIVERFLAALSTAHKDPLATHP
jgi:hypothetical protein